MIKLTSLITLVAVFLNITVSSDRTLAQEAAKDSALPTHKEAIALMQSICGVGNVTKKAGKVACRKCPSFTSDSENNGTGGTLVSVIYGRFTKSGDQEAIVDINDCEPHANNWGGTVLLRRNSRGWSKVQYKAGIRTNSCLKLAKFTGQNYLVCLNSYMGQGYLITSLNRIEFDYSTDIFTNILRVASNIATCRPPYYAVEIQDFFTQDINKDGIRDLVVQVSEVREAKNINTGNNQDCPRPSFPKAKLYELTFLSDNRSLRPTPETVKLKKRLESE
jgi:hypothetical protein